MTEFSNVPHTEPLSRVFEGILASQSFETVQGFLKEENWKGLLPEEKELLAQLFLLASDQLFIQLENFPPEQVVELVDGRLKILSYLQAACKLTPESARVWYRLGRYLSLQGDVTSIHESIKALKRSLEIDDGFFDAHYALASSLLRCGVMTKSILLYNNANKSFKKALKVLPKEGSWLPEFYWHWGITLFLLAKHSGEPVDYKNALGLYRKAYDLGLSSHEFLNDYANACVELGLLVGDDSIIRSYAIPFYQEALIELERQRIENDLSWQKECAVKNFNIATCFQYLYETTLLKEDFLQAERAFQNVEELFSDQKPQFWHKWGQLYFFAGRIHSAPHYFEKAIACFEQGERIFVENSGSVEEISSPVAYALWSEALLFLHEENGEAHLLSESYEKAQKAFNARSYKKSKSIHPEVYAAMGLVLAALGSYFQDLSYCDKARDIINQGLLEHTKSASLWYALGCVKSLYGQVVLSEDTLREALLAFLLASKSVYSRFSCFWTDWGFVFLSLAEWQQDASLAEEAVRLLERVLELQEEIDSNSIFNLACAYGIYGDLADKEEYTERALFLFQELKSRPSIDPHVLLQYASTQLLFSESTGDIESIYKAKELLEEYLAYDQEDEHALHEYALCLMHIGQIEEEKEESCDATGSERVIPAVLFQAEEILLRAAASGMQPAVYHLACLYAMMGNYGEAIEKLYEAIEIDSLPPPSDILNEGWLPESFLRTKQFHDFFSFYEKIVSLEHEDDSIP